MTFSNVPTAKSVRVSIFVFPLVNFVLVISCLIFWFLLERMRGVAGWERACTDSESQSKANGPLGGQDPFLMCV